MGRRWDSRPLAERMVMEWSTASAHESLATFCRRHGVRTESFRRWRTRLDALARSTPSTSVPSRPFVEIGSLGPRPHHRAEVDAFVAEIATPGGYVVRIGLAMPPSLLREILGSC